MAFAFAFPFALPFALAFAAGFDSSVSVGADGSTFGVGLFLAFAAARDGASEEALLDFMLLSHERKESHKLRQGSFLAPSVHSSPRQAW